MKKLTALLMVLVLAFSMAITVFADENITAESKTASVNLKKLYTITGAENVAGTEADESATVYPHETLSFVPTPAGTNPTTQNLTIEDLEVTGPNGEMSIILPAYTEIGKYVYTVSEEAGNAQGATYASGDITLTVLVTYNADHSALVSELYLTQTTAGEGTQTSQIEINNNSVAKVDTFVNTYEVGHLNIEKTVAGNLGSQTEEFEMTVTFTSEKPVMSDITCVDGSTQAAPQTIAFGTGWTEKTVTIYVKHGETVSFKNIPTGVTYTIEEAAKHGEGTDGFNPNSAADTDYKVEYTNKTGTIATNSTINAAVKNTKETTVETGVVLDSMPYVLMLTAAVLGMAALMGKKRYDV